MPAKKLPIDQIKVFFGGSIDPEQKKWLEDTAKANRVSKSSILREVVQFAQDNMGEIGSTGEIEPKPAINTPDTDKYKKALEAIIIEATKGQNHPVRMYHIANNAIHGTPDIKY